jgi:hypothetical protein
MSARRPRKQHFKADMIVLAAAVGRHIGRLESALASAGIAVPTSMPAKYIAAPRQRAGTVNLSTKALPAIDGTVARVGDTRREDGSVYQCIGVNLRPGERSRWRRIS